MKTLQKTLQGAAVVAALVASVSVAKADLTLQGAVGLPLNPTAQIPQEGGVRVQGNYTDLGRYEPDASNSSRLYSLNAAGRVGKNFELNGGIEKLDLKFAEGSVNRTGLNIGAKYLFSRESDPVGVRIAAGAGYSRAEFNNTYAYVVGTKYFGEVTEERVPITGHLGLRYDQFDYGFLGGDKSNKLSIYAGVELPVTRNGDVSVVGELQSKVVKFSGAKAPFSLSVRYRPQGQGFSASAGIMNRGISRESKGRLFAQIGYTFDTSHDSAGTTTTAASPVQ